MGSPFRYTKKSIQGINREIVIDPFSHHTGYENPKLPISGPTILGCWRVYVKDTITDDINWENEISLEKFNPKLHTRKFDWDLLIKKDKTEIIKDEVSKNILEQKSTFTRWIQRTLMRSNSDFKVKEQLRMLVSSLKFSKKYLSLMDGNVIQKEIANLYAESYSKTISYLQERYPDYYPTKNVIEISNNPFPYIFCSDQAYDLFTRIIEELSTYQADDFSFVYRKMIADELIYTIKQKVFKDFVNETYGIQITKIKTCNQLKTSKALKSFYTQLKNEIVKSSFPK